MIVRIWRAEIDHGRLAEYERFEREESLPMFRQQDGLLGVFFLRFQRGCAALSLWRDMEAVEALATSERYRQTVGNLESTGLLRGGQDVQIFYVAGGTLNAAALERVLSEARDSSGT